MDPHGTARERASEWLLKHLEQVEEDPDVLAAMPLEDVLDALNEGADHQAASRRIKARFASNRPAPGGSRFIDRADRTPARGRRRVWRAAAAVVALLSAFGILWKAGPGSLSEMERLVTLDAYAAEVDHAMDRPDMSKATNAGWAELEAGWTALRRAERQPLGLPFGYDDVAARQSAEHLEAAYRYGKSVRSGRIGEKAQPSRGLPPQGLVAFLAAQAYLMMENPERAHFWLQTASGYDDEPWRSAARLLLDRLPPPEQ